MPEQRDVTALRFALVANATLDTRSILVVHSEQRGKEAPRSVNYRGRDTEEVTSMPAKLTATCPTCGSPDPKIRGGECGHAFHEPKKQRRRPATGTLTAYLIARGWTRSDTPAEAVDFCGASSDTVGYCEKPGRWSRSFPHRSQLCAQHAEQAQRYIDRFETCS